MSRTRVPNDGLQGDKEYPVRIASHIFFSCLNYQTCFTASPWTDKCNKSALWVCQQASKFIEFFVSSNKG